MSVAIVAENNYLTCSRGLCIFRQYCHLHIPHKSPEKAFYCLSNSYCNLQNWNLVKALNNKMNKDKIPSCKSANSSLNCFSNWKIQTCSYITSKNPSRQYFKHIQS